MLNLILNLSILVVALPLSALAASHGHLLNRRHSGLAKRADGDVSLYARGPGSKWSFYNVETGNAGSCGRKHSNSEFIVALSASQMNPGLCFKTIRMTFGGKTTSAMITDTCPGCPPNGLDLTEGLFKFFSSPDAGIIYGNWEFADAAPAPPAPPPAPTTTRPAYTPPPPPTTTRAAPTPTTTTSTTPRPSTTSSRASSSGISASSSTSSGVASPSASSSKVPPESNNLDGIGQAFVQLGSLVVAGNSVSA